MTQKKLKKNLNGNLFNSKTEKQKILTKIK